MVFPHTTSLFKASAFPSRDTLIYIYDVLKTSSHGQSQLNPGALRYWDGVRKKSTKQLSPRDKRNVTIIPIPPARQGDARMPGVGWGWLLSPETTSPGQSCSR